MGLSRKDAKKKLKDAKKRGDLSISIKRDRHKELMEDLLQEVPNFENITEAVYTAIEDYVSEGPSRQEKIKAISQVSNNRTVEELRGKRDAYINVLYDVRIGNEGSNKEGQEEREEQKDNSLEEKADEAIHQYNGKGGE